MMEDYILLETLNESSVSIKDTTKIIKYYVEHEEEFADPIMCKQEHLIGKAFIPRSNATVFWFDIMDKKYFFDIQAGKQ